MLGKIHQYQFSIFLFAIQPHTSIRRCAETNESGIPAQILFLERSMKKISSNKRHQKNIMLKPFFPGCFLIDHLRVCMFLDPFFVPKYTNHRYSLWNNKNSHWHLHIEEDVFETDIDIAVIIRR